jgi:hypothetical protein
MGKVVETVVAVLQAEEIDRVGLMSDRQSGCRQRWLAIEVVANKVH